MKIFPFRFFSLTSLIFLGVYVPGFVMAEGEAGTLLENLRLRTTPSTSSQTVTILPKGTVVTIESESNDWFRVQSPSGKTGWMFAEYIAKTPIRQATTTESLHFGVYLENTRIRSTPEIKADNIIKVLSAGTRVTLKEKKGNWYQLKTANGVEGWSMSEFIKEVEDVGPEEEAEVLPGKIDVTELSEYWLFKINTLRKEKGLRELVLDSRFENTATEWAKYMKGLGVTTHERPDGKSMHKWIDAKGVTFSKRYSSTGWQTNYFTENIAWGITPSTTEGVERVLDNTLTFFLKEAATNGSHYRTIYHKDWNSVGLGFSFQPQKNGKYKVYIAMHYGSLQLK